MDLQHLDRPYLVVCGKCDEVLAKFEDNAFAAVIGDGPYSKHTHANMMGNRGRNVKGKKKIVRRDPGFEPLTPEEIMSHCSQFVRVGSQWIMLFSDDVTLPLWRQGIEAGKGKQVRTIPWVRWSSPNFMSWSPPSGAEFVVAARPARGPGSPKMRRWFNARRVSYTVKCLRSKSGEKTALAQWSRDADEPGHRAQKPEKLMVEICQDTCLPGDWIVDPYCGSGTTGVAALRCGLRVLLIDKDPVSAAMAQARMDREYERITQAIRKRAA